MKYCKVCLQPDSRPNLIFIDGLCSMCFYATGEFHDISERVSFIKDLIRNKKKPGKYDAVMGVSGGKDSTKQALFVKHVLGLNVLQVAVTYPPSQVSQTGIDNLNNLLNVGADIETISPSPITWKKLMKAGFLKFGNWAVSTERALFAGVPRLALERDISTVLWGENVAVMVGESLAVSSEGWNGNNIRNINTLTKIDNEWLKLQGISSHLVRNYLYPSQKDFESGNLQIIYLGWLMNCWSLLSNGVSAGLSGLTFRSGKWWESPDFLGLSSIDEDFFTINQMLKFYKFGFSRATEYVSEWIRAGFISRSEGVEIVTMYDGRCSEEIIDKFCTYLEISLQTFWDTVYHFANNKLFELHSSQKRPTPLFRPGIDL